MRAAERSKASVFAERNGKCVGAAVCCLPDCVSRLKLCPVFQTAIEEHSEEAVAGAAQIFAEMPAEPSEDPKACQGALAEI